MSAVFMKPEDDSTEAEGRRREEERLAQLEAVASGQHVIHHGDEKDYVLDPELELHRIRKEFDEDDEVRDIGVKLSSKDTNPKDAVGTGKAPLSTVPMGVMALVMAEMGRYFPMEVAHEVGIGMLEGARKYGRHNYRVAGVRASIYVDAACRHISKFLCGQEIDPDSCLSDITKAIASLTVLMDARIQDKLIDDRPPPCATNLDELVYEDAFCDDTVNDICQRVLLAIWGWWEGQNFIKGTQTHLLTQAMVELYRLRADQIRTGGSKMPSAFEDDRDPSACADHITGLDQKAQEMVRRYPDARDPYLRGDERQ